MNVSRLLFFLLIVLSACQEDSPPPVVPDPEINLLTFKQDVSSLTSFSDDWIYVTNEDGDVLDIKHFEADETIVLKSNKVTTSDKINVTIFHYRQPTTETIDFTSFLAITPNQTWIYKKIAGLSPAKTGTATLNLANAPIPLGATISTNLGNSSVKPSSPASTTFNLYKSSERMLARANINGAPSFFESTNVQDGVVIEADYPTDFKPLENIFTLDLSGSDSYAGSVYGITNEPGIDPYDIPGILNYSYNAGAVASCPWGYNSGFDLYRTTMGKSLGKTSRQYFKLGPAVTTIPFPDHTFSPVNNDLNSFAFTISSDYQLRSSRWTVSVPDYQSVLSWRVYSPPAGKQVFPKIPDEIKSLYPALSIESLVLKENAFTIYLDGFTFTDDINGQMNISSSKKPYSTEYQRVIIQN